jgi:hypothetical protein
MTEKQIVAAITTILEFLPSEKPDAGQVENSYRRNLDALTQPSQQGKTSIGVLDPYVQRATNAAGKKTP